MIENNIEFAPRRPTVLAASMILLAKRNVMAARMF